MKSGIVFFLAATRALRELDIPVSRRVLLQLNCDEEVGSHSSRELTRKMPRRATVFWSSNQAPGSPGNSRPLAKGWGLSCCGAGKASHSGVDFAAGASAMLELARFWEEHPPGNRIEKQWNEMVDNDSQNSPFPRGKRIQNLPDALVNQKSGK